MEFVLNSRYPPFTARKVKQVEQSTMPSFPPRDSVYAEKQQSLKWIIIAAAVTVSVWFAFRPFDLF